MREEKKIFIVRLVIFILKKLEFFYKTKYDETKRAGAKICISPFYV